MITKLISYVFSKNTRMCKFALKGHRSFVAETLRSRSFVAETNRRTEPSLETPELLALRNVLIEYPDLRGEEYHPEETLARLRMDFSDIEFRNDRNENSRFRNRTDGRRIMAEMEDLNQEYLDVNFFEDDA